MDCYVPPDKCDQTTCYRHLHLQLSYATLPDISARLRSVLPREQDGGADSLLTEECHHWRDSV